LLSTTVLLASVARLCTAEEASAEPPVSERGPLAEQYLTKRLALWQERLQLQNWKISLIMSHPDGLRAGTLGNVDWDPDQKTAKIRVLDASEYQKPYQAALKDMEFTLVHELIHVELAALPRNDASRNDEEDAVNRMAEALLHLDRGDQNLPGPQELSSKGN
jgi:hypothetical protein